MTFAALALSVAALGGVAMVVIRLSGSPRPPTWLALGHGVIAVTGLVLLGFAVFDPKVSDLGPISFSIAAFAALGGTALFTFYHTRSLPLPIPLMLAHSVLALTGLALVLATCYRH